MAHFAKLDDNNVVLQIDVVMDSDCLDGSGNESESVGITFLNNLTGHSNWKQTSYNTYRNAHKDGGTPLRKNYAAVGGTYDSTNDCFWSPKPFPSWVKNTTVWDWVAPVAEPTPSELGDINPGYLWNESSGWWEGYKGDDSSTRDKFDSTAKSWSLIS